MYGIQGCNIFEIRLGSELLVNRDEKKSDSILRLSSENYFEMENKNINRRLIRSTRKQKDYYESSGSDRDY